MRESDLPDGLTESELAILEELWVGGSSYLYALQNKKGMPGSSTITKILKRLLSWGMIGLLKEEEGKTESIDRKIYEITDLGRWYVIVQEETPSDKLQARFAEDDVLGDFYQVGLGHWGRVLAASIISLGEQGADPRSPETWAVAVFDYVARIMEKKEDVLKLLQSKKGRLLLRQGIENENAWNTWLLGELDKIEKPERAVTVTA